MNNTTRLCKHGHELDEANTYMNPRGHQECKACRYLANKRTRAVNLEAISKADDRSRFGNNREKAIQRDGEKCIQCGMTRQEHKAKFGRDITVDHIDGAGRYTPKSEKNNDMDNLQTLCLSCHGKKDIVRREYRKVHSERMGL